MDRLPAPRAGPAALAGMLAAGAGVGAGHLVAGVVSPASSPFVAVGDAAVRLSPQPLTEFATATFGTADKTVLLLGIALVLALAAAGAGLASRHSPRPGTAVLVVLGLLGAAAVVTAPTFAPLDLLAPAAALAVAVRTFALLHARLPRSAAAGEPAGPVAALVARRRFLAATAAVGAGALVAGGAGALAAGGPLGSATADSRARVTGRLAAAAVARPPAPPPGADFTAALGTTPFVTANADFYRIDAALRVPQLTAEDWRLRVHGMVDRPLELGFDDLLARPLVARRVTLTCVSNPVGGDLVSTAEFVGVELGALLREAGVRPGAEQLLSTSTDGWTAGTPVDVVRAPERGALLAVGMNGEALPPEHGFPVRMIVPGLYGYVSATKWVTDLEVTTFARQAYWVQRGWAQRAPVKTQCRIDLPRPSARLDRGPVTAAGVAWAPPLGISRVEVAVDDGPWQVAELAADAGGDTWRMWRASMAAGPGRHTLRCRATDAGGTTQPAERTDPVPDGATGWPSVEFTVA